jgi:membrane-associated phospholipid phosphatase
MSDVQRPDCKGKEGLLAWRAEVGAVRSGVHAVRRETERRGIVAPVTQELARAWAACGAFEWIALGYLALSCILIAMFSENLPHPMRLIGMQAFAAGVILILCRMEIRAPGWRAGSKEKRRGTDRNICPTARQRFWRFWRHWYPHLFFLFCFEEMGKLVHLVTPGWQDSKLIAFDQWLTGVNPALWLERFAHPALNEFMHFAYLTYFVYLLIVGGLLYYQRDWKSYWAVMTYSAIGYVLGYFISMFLPVQSPWFSMAGMWHGELVGGPLTALVNLIEKCGRVHGAAFPSQHVAGAVAALWGAWQHRRRLFWVFLPFVLCMCVSTVYVRNHYVADVLGGMVTGTLGYVIGVWLMQKQEAVAARA